MKIERIRLKNYKAFQDVTISDLPDLALFVGANGTGKSTLFDVFGFLHDALKNNIRQALARRGRFKEVVSRGKSGPIEIELKFRLAIAGKSRLATYLLEIEEEHGQPYIAREVLRYKRSSYGSPCHFLDFRKGEGYAINNEEDFSKKDEELTKEPQSLEAADILAIKGLGQFKKFKAAMAFRDFIENWHVSDFHIADARPSQEAGYAEHLSETGNNPALVAQYIYESHPDIFQQILEKMKQRVPGIEHVQATATEDGRILLKFQDGAFRDPFIAPFVSDGTIKMFAYLLLLHDPKPYPLLCIEEPENQLYPTLMNELLDEFRHYTQKGGQVFIATHSPDLLMTASPSEVLWMKKENGFTSVNKASDMPEIQALYKEGELLGYLWKQGFFKGSDPQ